MKSTFIFLVFILLLVSYSCKKPEPLITYPVTYDNRLNILRDSDFALQPGNRYSVAAFLPEGTSISVVVKPTDGINWGGAGFLTPDRTGYQYHDFYPQSVEFKASGEDDYVNVDVIIGSSATSIDFIIYENNSSVITRQKTVRNFKL